MDLLWDLSKFFALVEENWGLFSFSTLSSSAEPFDSFHGSHLFRLRSHD